MNEQHVENDLTRRKALKLGLLGAAGMALSEPLNIWAQNAANQDKTARPWKKKAAGGDKLAEIENKSPRAASGSPKAKAVIQIWMWEAHAISTPLIPSPTRAMTIAAPITSRSRPRWTGYKSARCCR